MSFAVAPEAYDQFMGRFSAPLAPLFADLAAIAPGQRAIDVGCGTGALTRELAARLGESRVCAVDPSPPFVIATKARYPGVTVERAPAEELPFPTGHFDAALAQLVVHFMPDPVAGATEMARVTKKRGVVATCVWDHAEGGGPLQWFWQAARDVDPACQDESDLTGTRRGQLTELLRAAGLRQVEESTLEVRVGHSSFETWWEPFTLGVGPAGKYLSELDPQTRSLIRARCREIMPDPPFTQTARAWAARGIV